MEPATGPWLELTVRCDASVVETVAEVFATYGIDQGIAVAPSSSTDNPGAAVADGAGTPAPWVTVRAALKLEDVAPERWAAIHADLWQLRQALWLRSRSQPIGELELIERQAAAETARRMEDYTVHPVGHRVLVKAPWHDYEPAADEVVITLDPGRVFGVGYHPSTQLVMEALEEELQAGDRVLDVGVGAGPLTIAAAKLGARAVDAVDIEPAAVELARANAARNGVAEIVRVARGSVGPDGPFPGRYDLVVANIVAPVLMDLAPALAQALTPEGTLLLGGVHEIDEAAVRAAFEAEALTLDRRAQRKEWVTLVWRAAS
ncbi:MAG TPA: 50S ribosomal protein L11 methyltransferase [Thermomicrobiales bacterium]|nr:50S ribosomal protein L11 methyltransferase [Thermomicrobiales bacterium]